MIKPLQYKLMYVDPTRQQYSADNKFLNQTYLDRRFKTRKYIKETLSSKAAQLKQF